MIPISEFVYHRRVQFPETDASGIVHFTNFFKYVEEAEHAMWRAAGVSIADRSSGFSWPRVAASFDFKRPLRFEDEFDVVIRVAEMKSRTIRYECALEKDGTTLATGTMTIACVRKQPTMHAVDIPAAIRERLER